MNAGELDEIIEILRKKTTTNRFGEEVESYVSQGTYKAHVWHRSGGRRYTNSEVVYDYAKTLQVRIYVPIDENLDVIKWEGKKYRILDVDKNKELQCKTINIEEIQE